MSGQDRPTGWGGDPVRSPETDEIECAVQRLQGHVVRTPLLRWNDSQCRLFLKPELLQPSGSYKVRGVLNWAESLTDQQRAAGLSTHSSGNTAKALGYVAQLYGVDARSLMPDSVSAAKVAAVESFGVNSIQVSIEELIDFVFEERWKEEPYPFLNPWAEPAMLAGNATIAQEILADLPDVASVFIPVGGGGLIAGVACALKSTNPNIQIIAVQPEACAPLRASFEAGHPVWVKQQDSICDGTAVPLVIDEAFPLLQEIVDEVIVVSEGQVREAIRELAVHHKLIVEGSGAMSVAAVLTSPNHLQDNSVCLLTGGSIGTAVFTDVLK